MSPTELSLRKLKEEGYLAKVVEHWNHYARIRQDLFGFDIIAFADYSPENTDKDREGTTLIQCTTDSNMSARVNKLADMESTAKLREAGVRLLVWGWRKKDGKWQCREKDIS